MWCNFHVMLWYTYLVPLLGRLKGESQIKSFLRLAIKPGYCFVTNGREHALRQSKWHSFWRTADARKVCFQNSFTVANLNCQLSSQKQTNKKLFPNYFQLLFSSYYFPVISKFCWLNLTSTSFAWLLQRVVCGSDQRRILSDFFDNLGPTPKNLAKNTTHLWFLSWFVHKST